MIKTTVHLLEKYNIRFDNSCRIFVDAANPSFISTLKQAVNEDPDYTKQIQYYKHNYPSIYDLQFLQQNMFVIPVAFSKEHKHMLAHCKAMPEYQNGLVAINPKHNKLVISLRTAVENGEGSLDKESTSHDDLWMLFVCLCCSGIDYIDLDSGFDATSLFMKFSKSVWNHLSSR